MTGATLFRKNIVFPSVVGYVPYLKAHVPSDCCNNKRRHHNWYYLRCWLCAWMTDIACSLHLQNESLSVPVLFCHYQYINLKMGLKTTIFSFISANCVIVTGLISTVYLCIYLRVLQLLLHTPTSSSPKHGPEIPASMCVWRFFC